MSLLTRTIILTLLLIIGALTTLPATFDNSLLKLHLEQKISQNLQSGFEIKGDTNLVFLPSPRIILNDVKLSNWHKNENIINADIQKITIKPTLFSLFGKLKINSIKLEAPLFEIGKYTKNSKNDISQEKTKPIYNIDNKQAKFSDKIFNFRDNSSEIFAFKNIKKIFIKKGNLIKKDDNNEIAIEFKGLDIDVVNNMKKQIFDIEGAFTSNGIPTAIELALDVNKNNDSRLIVNSSILNLVLEGTFADSNINDLIKSNFTGKFDAQIIDLKAVLNQYFSKTNLIYRKINTTKTIKLSADIKSENGKINAKNIIINSDLISGKGEIKSNMSKSQPIIDVNLDISNIDIDNIWVSKIKIKDQKIINLEKNVVERFISDSAPQKNQNTKSNSKNNINLTVDIDIKRAKYMDDDLKDIKLYFITSKTGEILLKPLSLEIPGKSQLSINGSFKNKNNIPRFNGTIDLVGEDLEKTLSWLKIKPKNLKENKLNNYNLEAKILFSPNFIVLNKIKSSINNNSNNVTGNIQYDTTNNLSTFDLIVDDLNIEDYFDLSKSNKYISHGSLLTKMLWLNTIHANKDITIFFKKLSYKDEIFYNQSLRISVGQGHFKLSEVDIQTKNIDAIGFLSIDISGEIPQIEIGLIIDKLHYKNDAINSDFLDKLFSLPSLANFNGNANINITDFKINDFPIKDIDVSGVIENGKLFLKNSQFNMYNGKLTYNGLIVLNNTKTINGSFQFVNINNQDLLSKTLGLNNINGISNASGTVNSFGKNKQEFIRNIELQSKFVAGNVFLEGFGIDSLVRKMLYFKKYEEDLKNPLEILFNKNEKSLFQNVSGNINISKTQEKRYLKITTESLGINSITSGFLDFHNKAISASSNIIFITGSRENQIPLNIAINYSGKLNELNFKPNITQIEDYLWQVRKNRR